MFLQAGVDQVPISWVNKRLEEIGETWRVQLNDGGYVLKASAFRVVSAECPLLLSVEL